MGELLDGAGIADTVENNEKIGKRKKKVEEEYDYIKSMNVEELLKIIDDFNDMDATVEAMLVLWERDEEKTLEKGISFLANNEGDEYFQARIVNVINDIDFCKVLVCISQRKENIQAYLLGEIMNKMVIYASCDYVHKYVNFAIKQYRFLNEKEKNEISEHYNEFVDEFKVKNE